MNPKEMKDLIKIDIVFENCDSISLHKDVIHGFVVNNVRENYFLFSNVLVINKIVGESYLSIRKSLVKFATTKDGTNLIERLAKYKDITHYYLYLTDGSEIKLTLPWQGKYENDFEIHNIENDFISIQINKK